MKRSGKQRLERYRKRKGTLLSYRVNRVVKQMLRYISSQHEDALINCAVNAFMYGTATRFSYNEETGEFNPPESVSIYAR
jgi:hypothetical protein